MSAFAVSCTGERCYIKGLRPVFLRRKVARPNGSTRLQSAARTGVGVQRPISFRVLTRLRQSRDELDVPFLCREKVLAVPPAAAQRLKQCCGIGKAGSLRLDEGNQRRIVGVL